MGAWGTGIYQDDVAEDVRSYYKDQLHRGKTGEMITQELLRDYREEIEDQDDGPVFWFALADTQWNLGRLEESVKEHALEHIRDGYDLRRWEEENPREAKKRAKVLSDLEQKLMSPQPPEKKISQYRLYRCEWKLGDVYAYPLESEYAKETGLDGRYFLFYKVGEGRWWPGHIIPVVRVKITRDHTLPSTVEEFDQLEYVKIAYIDWSDPMYRTNGKIYGEYSRHVDIPEYCLELITTSKRAIPKSIFYLNHFEDVQPPMLEYIPDNTASMYAALWKNFDEVIIGKYFHYKSRGEK